MNNALTLTPEEIAGLPPDGGPDFNRLIFEQSPYLLQHATNPVDWYPWGEDAFARARDEDKPVFLSIGYSTCHWCHVMERESFEDEDVAALLNDRFVAIKVDREERPDLDQIYMAVTQGLTGGGGWPMTVVLTPEGKPFFAGTYFPREGRYGRPGMLELLPRLAEAWASRRGEVLQSAEQITSWLRSRAGTGEDAELDEETLHLAYRELSSRFDPAGGGFGQAPKFPTPHNLAFLLRYWKRFDEPHALDMVEITLEAMSRGGVWDHVGCGFHRYSTDGMWLVPHFEKMLYDQALLAEAYLDAFLVTGREEYSVTAHRIFEYVLRDLTDSSGGFYSAEDADSEGEEGRYYLWSVDEVESVLGGDAPLFIDIYGLEESGNFREEATGQYTGRNIPHLRRPLSTEADERSIPAGELEERLAGMRSALFEVREGRIRPHTDDKILTDWNGLMIAALARGGRILDDLRYVKAAEDAAGFLWRELRDGGGNLLKRYRNGTAGLPAHLDDYAFFVHGLIELYETTFDTRWLERAVELSERMLERFHDPGEGAFFFTAATSEDLLVRQKEIYDGATPSGNSVAALSLLRLGRITARPEWESVAAGVLTTFGGQVKRSPSGFTWLLAALDFLRGPSAEVVVAGRPEAEETGAMLRALQTTYFPNCVVIFRPEPGDEPPISRLAPFTTNQRAMGESATAYVCRNYSCNRPVTSVDEMFASLTEITPREEPER